MEILPYHRSHAEALKLQPAQAHAYGYLSPEYMAALEGPYCWTAKDGELILGCGGAWELWGGRALAWSLLSGEAGSHMLSVHKAVYRFLNGLPMRRIETYVDADFKAGHRWAEMLGFKLETPEGMKGFLPDGKAAFMYARVR